MSEQYEERETVSLTPEEQMEAIRRDLPEEAQPFALSSLSADRARKIKAEEDDFTVGYDHMKGGGNLNSFKQSLPDIFNQMDADAIVALGNMSILVSAGNGMQTENQLFNNLLEVAFQDPGKFCQINLRRETAGKVSVAETDVLLAVQDGLRKGDPNMGAQLNDWQVGLKWLRQTLEKKRIDPDPPVGGDHAVEMAFMKRQVIRAISEARSRANGPLSAGEIQSVVDFQLEKIPGTHRTEFTTARPVYRLLDELSKDPEREKEILDFLQEQGREANPENIIEQIQTKEYQTVKDAKELFAQLPSEIQNRLRQEFMKGEDVPPMQEHLMMIAYLTHLKAQDATKLDSDMQDLMVDLASGKKKSHFDEEAIKKIAGLLGVETGFVRARLHIDSGLEGESPLDNLFEQNPALKRELSDPKITQIPLNESSTFTGDLSLSVDDKLVFSSRNQLGQLEQATQGVRKYGLELTLGIKARRIQSDLSYLSKFDELEKLIARMEELRAEEKELESPEKKEQNQREQRELDLEIWLFARPGDRLAEDGTVYRSGVSEDRNIVEYLIDDKTEKERQAIRGRYLKSLKDSVNSFSEYKEELKRLNPHEQLERYRAYANSSDPEDRKKAEELRKRYLGTIVMQTIYEGMPDFVVTAGLGAVPGVGPFAATIFSSSSSYCLAFMEALEKAGIDPTTIAGQNVMKDPERMQPLFMEAMKKAFGAGALSLIAGAIGAEVAPSITSSKTGQVAAEALAGKAAEEAVKAGAQAIGLGSSKTALQNKAEAVIFP